MPSFVNNFFDHPSGRGPRLSAMVGRTSATLSELKI